MKDTIVIAVTALLCITIIVAAGVATGHNNALLSGGMATIAGIAASFGAYKASKAKYPAWHDERVTKETHKPDQSTTTKPD